MSAFCCLYKFFSITGSRAQVFLTTFIVIYSWISFQNAGCAGCAIYVMYTALIQWCTRTYLVHSTSRLTHFTSTHPSIFSKKKKNWSPNKGLEPLTLRLKVWCSTNWANRALTTGHGEKWSDCCKNDYQIPKERCEQDSNLRGKLPLDFKSNALTTRPSQPTSIWWGDVAQW